MPQDQFRSGHDTRCPEVCCGWSPRVERDGQNAAARPGYDEAVSALISNGVMRKRFSNEAQGIPPREWVIEKVLDAAYPIIEAAVLRANDGTEQPSASDDQPEPVVLALSLPAAAFLLGTVEHLNQTKVLPSASAQALETSAWLEEIEAKLRAAFAQQRP